MISVKNDKTEWVSAPIILGGWYVIDNEELERKVMTGFPDIDFVLDDNGEVIDVIYTKPLPPTMDEKMEKAYADIAYLAMMADIDIEEE